MGAPDEAACIIPAMKARFAVVVAACAACLWPFAEAQAPPPFTYRGQTFVMDDFAILFDMSPLGRERTRLFTGYLGNSTEGKARVAKAGSPSPEAVWKTMTVDERATFLSITKALDVLQPTSGPLKWLDRVEEIHGDRSFTTGREWDSDKAFRLWARMTTAGIDAVRREVPLRNMCRQSPETWNGDTLNHPDFCGTGGFEFDRKTDKNPLPNVQFNITTKTACADIDLDYEGGLAHLGRSNSDVLDSDHSVKFRDKFCDFGVRRFP
jgi:hypothetical protein